MHRLFADQRGSVTILSAVLMVIVLTCVGLAIDTGVWNKRKDELQSVMDAASVAGARALATGNAESALAATRAYLSQRGDDPKKFQIAADAALSTVTVTRLEKVHRFFSVFALKYDPTIPIVSVARHHKQRKLCALAVDNAGHPGIVFRGDGELTGPNCVTWTNSTMPKAFSVEKAIDVSLGKMCAVGGAMNHSSGMVMPQPVGGCEMQPDPLEWFALPVPAGCDHTNFNSSDPVINLTPGTYCGGITISSDKVRAAPGIYYIKDGDVAISGTSDVIFDGATIYLSGSKLGLTVKGDSKLIIAAPQSGPTADVAVAMDPAGVPAKQTSFGGSSHIYISGAIHVPKQKLTISGDSVGVAELDNAILIAGTIDFGGGAQWKWTNTDRMPDAADEVSVQLVK